MSAQHEVTIDSIANGGEGVCRIDNLVCFVPGGLPGDRLRVEVVGGGKRFSNGKIAEVIEPSPFRIDAPCPTFPRCGGSCPWINFAYPAQAEWKQRIVRECFQRIGKLAVDVEWAEEPGLRLGYRTRATFQSDGTQRGFYAPDSHDVVDIASCPLCHAKLNAAFQGLRASNVPGAVELVVNPEGDEVLAWSETHAPALREVFADACGPEDEERAGFAFDGVPIVCGAFSQSSLLLNRTLVRIAHGFIGEAKSLLDLFCGSGNFSLGLAESVQVVGLDHDPYAIGAAEAQGRGMYRVAGERSFRRHIEERAWDAILLDPPRRGAKELMRYLAKAKTETIVYVSCDPGSLARDAGLLAAAGWNVKRVVAVDMYPNTPHIETVCQFTRS